jgi:hypothetical protein
MGPAFEWHADEAIDTPALWECNDCGLLCLKGDELCGECYREQQNREFWEELHPEARCPPRE